MVKSWIDKVIRGDDMGNDSMGLTGLIILILLIIIIMALPIIPKENCVRLLGYNVACTTQYISIIQPIFGK